MQGSDENAKVMVMPKAPSITPPSAPGPRHQENRCLPRLSSEPDSPASVSAIASVSAPKVVAAALPVPVASKWSPPAFVDLKGNKTPTLIPQVSCHRKQTAIMPTASSHLSLPREVLKLDATQSIVKPVKSMCLATTTTTLATTITTESIDIPKRSCAAQVVSNHPAILKSQQQQPSYKDVISENVQLKIELGEAKKEIARLKKDMARASCNISELRGTLTGGNKISEIPLVDMIEIMQEYGSEVSGQSFQKRKEDPQPASIVRQFRRWNPDFLKYFYRKNGKWLPKLGKAGELQRRKLKRDALRAHRRNPPQGPQPHAS